MREITIKFMVPKEYESEYSNVDPIIVVEDLLLLPSRVDIGFEVIEDTTQNGIADE